MPLATDAQVQTFVDQKIRPLAETMRSVEIQLTACLGQINDVYQACAQASPTWSDSRKDGPPHLATPGDVVNMNGIMTRVLAAITGDSQYPVLLNMCVRSPSGD